MRLVSRSDVIAAQPLGYLLTERERERDGGKRGQEGLGKRKKKEKEVIKV